MKMGRAYNAERSTKLKCYFPQWLLPWENVQAKNLNSATIVMWFINCSWVWVKLICALNMYFAKGYYSHCVFFLVRILSGTAGLGHRLGRTASQHAGGRRFASIPGHQWHAATAG